MVADSHAGTRDKPRVARSAVPSRQALLTVPLYQLAIPGTFTPPGGYSPVCRMLASFNVAARRCKVHGVPFHTDSVQYPGPRSSDLALSKVAVYLDTRKRTYAPKEVVTIPNPEDAIAKVLGNM